MRTGRPVSEDPRAYKISARLTASELEEFEAYARRQGMTNAEVIKRGIQMQLDAEMLESKEHEVPDNISASTLESMDKAISNFKTGEVSATVDLSNF